MEEQSVFDAGPKLNNTATIRSAKKPLQGTSQETDRTVKVDFVLMRSVSRGIHGQDSRNMLYALVHGNANSGNATDLWADSKRS